MISLIITLFICLFSVCPTNSQVVDHTENNVKRSIDYWETGVGELVLSNGYTTGYQELANSQIWDKMENTFGTIYSEFTNDYADWNHYQEFNCTGLYVQIPPYFTYDSGYENTYNYITTNYSNNLVNKIRLYNRRYYPWSSVPKDCYGHAIDFLIGGDRVLEILFYKSLAGANQCSYSLEAQLWVGSTYTNQMTENFTLFATNSFTYGDVFKTLDTWELTTQAEEMYQEGYRIGYETGVQTGTTAGETTGYGEGYQVGYQEGLAHADYDSTALTIMQGIIDVGLLPVNVFLMILNFEVFGVNISGFVSALLTISIVIIIVRFLFGGKSDGK